jgi:hypothetical protein
MAPQDTPWAHRIRPASVLGRGESRELDDLVDAEVTVGERLSEPRQGLERVCRGDPPVRLPRRDPVADAEPVGHVVRAVVTPGLTPVDLADEREQCALRTRDQLMNSVHLMDELLIRLRFAAVHVASHRSGGGRGGIRKGIVPNICSRVKRVDSPEMSSKTARCLICDVLERPSSCR